MKQPVQGQRAGAVEEGKESHSERLNGLELLAIRLAVLRNENSDEEIEDEGETRGPDKKAQHEGEAAEELRDVAEIGRHERKWDAEAAEI